MKPFRFIHAADLHLDSPFRGLQGLPPAVRDRVRGAAFAALDRLTELALREQVDFVLVAGDVYDAVDRSLRAQLRFRESANRLAAAGIPLLVVHGNHDPDDGRAARLEWPKTVRFFSTRDVESVPVHASDGTLLAQVYGYSFPTPAVAENVAARFVPRGEEPYRIALLHANVDGDEGHDNYAPCSLGQLAESGFDYWALGHIHDRRVLRETPFVVYPGNLQGRSVRETGPKGCYLVEVSETRGTRLHFYALDEVRWFRIEYSVAGLETEEQLLEGIRERVGEVREAADGRAAMVRLVLKGRSSLHAALRKPGVTEELAAELREGEERLAQASVRAAFVWLESIRLETGMPVDREELLAESSFIGDVLREAGRLGRDEAELSAFIQDVLEPLAVSPQLSRWIGSATNGTRNEWLARAKALLLELLNAAE